MLKKSLWISFTVFLVALMGVQSLQSQRLPIQRSSSSEPTPFRGVVNPAERDSSGPSWSPSNSISPRTPVAGNSFTAPRIRPTVGAFYYAWFKADGFHWEETKGRPVLGNEGGFYDSGDPYIIHQHISWAKEFGINFWLLSFWDIANEAYQWDNLREVIRACEDRGFQYVILIEPDSRIFNHRRNLDRDRIDEELYLERATNWFLSRIRRLERSFRFMDSPVYLREEDGRQVLAFFHWDSPDIAMEVLRRSLEIRPDLRDRYWFWYLGGHGAGNHIEEIKDVLLPNVGSWAPYVPIAEEGWHRTLELYESISMQGDKRLLTVAPSFDNTGLVSPPTVFPRDNGRRWQRFLLDIEQLPKMPNYLLITSWNEWQEDSIIEPDLAGPEPFIYLSILRNWLNTF